MWTVLVSRALINVGFYTLFGFLFFFVRESLGVGADAARTTTGILFLAFTVAGVFGAAVAGRPADRIDKRVVVSVACAAIAVAVGAFAFAPTFTVALVVRDRLGRGVGRVLHRRLGDRVLRAAARRAGVGDGRVEPRERDPADRRERDHRPGRRRSSTRAAWGSGPRVALMLVIVEFVLGTAWLWRLRLNGSRAVR